VTTKLTMVTKQDVPTLIQISGIWVDVMRMGLEAESNQPDAEWWLQHQKEIAFAFKVLAGLGLANQGGTTKDGKVVWTPSRPMKRLYRNLRYFRYLSARDKHLQIDLAFQYALLDDIK
jgi:hypothetical protein